MNPEALEVPESAVYYSAGGPYCIITGSGPVGMRVKELLEKLGNHHTYIFLSFTHTTKSIHVKNLLLMTEDFDPIFPRKF